MARTRVFKISTLIVLILCSSLLWERAAQSTSLQRVYLPLVFAQQVKGSSTYRINAPRLGGDVSYGQAAIFWFGQLTSASNYADVRVGYTDSELYLHLAAFDRYLWYDTAPIQSELTSWDAATLYLNLGDNIGTAPGPNAYRFVGMLSWWEESRNAFQAAYRGNGTSWENAAVAFTTEAGWRGNAPNDGRDDRGWTIDFHIPFTSLGLSGPPAEGAIWGIGVVLHDRDDAAGTAIPDQIWPPALDFQDVSTWGRLAFSTPTYSPPPASRRETVTIRQGLNGAVVADAATGGTTGNLCPGDADYIWNRWGDDNFARAEDFNIQNQGDVADWPCFAKYYVTFPLNTVPAGKVIVSATLTLHQFGNAGECTPGPDCEPQRPQPSWIQVLVPASDWDEETITWNNAPLAKENIGGSWVDPLASWPPWPGVARTWDVSRVVADAYGAGQPARLVLYSADWEYHSGRYFVSSDTGDWNAEGRPTLQVEWGDP